MEVKDPGRDGAARAASRVLGDPFPRQRPLLATGNMRLCAAAKKGKCLSAAAQTPPWPTPEDRRVVAPRRPLWAGKRLAGKDLKGEEEAFSRDLGIFSCAYTCFKKKSATKVHKWVNV
jgi:hypothetical protein